MPGRAQIGPNRKGTRCERHAPDSATAIELYLPPLLQDFAGQRDLTAAGCPQGVPQEGAHQDDFDPDSDFDLDESKPQLIVPRTAAP